VVDTDQRATKQCSSLNPVAASQFVGAHQYSTCNGRPVVAGGHSGQCPPIVSVLPNFCCC